MEQTVSAWAVDNNQSLFIYSKHPIRDQRKGAQGIVSAFRIYSAILAELDRAVNAHDVALWNSLFQMPYHVHTDERDFQSETAESNTQFLNNLVAMLQDKGIERLQRVADHAEFLADDQIRGYHMAYFTSDGDECLAPVASRMNLRLLDGIWKVSAVTNSVANTEWPYKQPQISDGLVTEMHIRQRSKLLG